MAEGGTIAEDGTMAGWHYATMACSALDMSDMSLGCMHHVCRKANVSLQGWLNAGFSTWKAACGHQLALTAGAVHLHFEGSHHSN
jgi:hypothetical protein